MELRNRMMNHAPMTMPMDLLGLRKRGDTVLRLTDHPQPTKENRTMKPFLTLKDAPIDQSAESAATLLARYVQERPLDVQAAVRALGPNASITEIVSYIQHLDQPTQRSGRDYLLKIANDSENKFRDEESWTAASRKAVEALSVPLNKRIVPGFSRIY